MQITSPEWIWAILIALVGAGLAFGIMQNRARSARNVSITEDATEDLYNERTAESGTLDVGEARRK